MLLNLKQKPSFPYQDFFTLPLNYIKNINKGAIYENDNIIYTVHTRHNGIENRAEYLFSLQKRRSKLIFRMDEDQ